MSGLEPGSDPDHHEYFVRWKPKPVTGNYVVSGPKMPKEIIIPLKEVKDIK